MKTHLRSVQLKTGETMDIARVTCPDEEFRVRILAFLEHKGPDWRVPMAENLAAELEGLGQHFYLGLIGDEIVGNASSVEALQSPVGILQHVFTPPERRRQGIGSNIIRAYVEDFDARGGRAAYLHTDHDSPAYHIYESAGFVGYLDTGTMERFSDPGFIEDFFGPRPATVRDTLWQDWALLECLYGTLDGWYLRSLEFGQWGRSSYEGEYIRLRKEMGNGHITQVKVLAAGNGAVVGHAYLSRNRVFRGDTWLLDFFVHPNYYGEGLTLLHAIDLDLDAKVQCFVESSQPEKSAVLKQRGLALEATLPRHVKKADDWLDVTIYAT